MTENPEIVTIGHTSIDSVEIGGKTTRQLGGAAVYSAMAAKTFGKTGIVSRVGRDFPPSFLKILTEAGISTTGIRKLNGKSTLFEIEYDEDGAAHYRGFKLNAGRQIQARDIPLSFLNAKGFHIAPMNPGKQRRIVDFLREKTYAIVSLNTYMGYARQYKKALLDLMPMVDIFTMNDDEAMVLSDKRTFEHALKKLKKTLHNHIIITMGVFGSIVLSEGEINFFPAVYQERVVDLTGCGDAFAGSFLAAYVKTGDPYKAANIANSVAGLNATGWNYQALKPLEFKSLERFQLYITSRQRRLKKKQKMLEAFFK
ncbi:MAG: carbohydrate kinase family protein [Methanobacteriota archaeon]|nr:MAG: carbohydrate kinase family protein [Euryarchaeota archaeon]